MTDALTSPCKANVAQNGATRLVIIGAFPPPTVGLAVVNAVVRECLLRRALDLVSIDLSAPSLDRRMFARLGRLPRVVSGLWRVLLMGNLQGRTLYLSVSGGWGQLYELLFVALGRLRRMHAYLHHHSYAYLHTPNLVTRLLLMVAGEAAVHITQSPGMAERLRALYGVTTVIPISNAVFLAPISNTRQSVARRSLCTIGFMGNISAEKGIFVMLDLLEAAQAADLPLQAKIAGPFQDPLTEREVRRRLRVLSNVEYVGPKYGDEKAAFFSQIDALIFPTCYSNETEGIVNHEAMCRGIPVIAYGRGCIPEIITSDCGKVIDPSDVFVEPAILQLRQWLSDPGAFQNASRAAARRFSEIYVESESRWRKLLDDFSNGPAKFN